MHVLITETNLALEVKFGIFQTISIKMTQSFELLTLNLLQNIKSHLLIALVFFMCNKKITGPNESKFCIRLIKSIRNSFIVKYLQVTIKKLWNKGSFNCLNWNIPFQNYLLVVEILKLWHILIWRQPLKLFLLHCFQDHK